MLSRSRYRGGGTEMIRFFALGLLGTLIGVMVPAVRAQAPQQPRRTGNAPPGNIENGKKSFREHGSASCHRNSGQGGAGARLAQNPITYAAPANYVRKPTRSMPACRSDVTPA